MEQPIRVLIAEDNAMVGELIQGILRRLGYAVVGLAPDGREAVRRMGELAGTAEQPDVVLMDVEMPGMNGIEASRQIQARYPTPVVILTAYDQPDLVEQASDVGVGAYLIKPPNLSELERAITIAIARFEDMRALDRLNVELQEEVAERKRAEEALNASNRELRRRHHQEAVLAKTVSRFNTAASAQDVIDTLFESVRDLGYTYFSVWERRGERLYWGLERRGLPGWLLAGIDKVAGSHVRLPVWAEAEGDSIYARCMREHKLQKTDRGADLLEGLRVGKAAFRELPGPVQQAAHALVARLEAPEHIAFPLGEYGLVFLSSPQAEDPAHLAWVELVIAQAATAIERQRLIAELQQALAEVRTLNGLLPICANCKKIRDDKGYWQQVEVYIQSHSEAEFSHGICPECAHALYPEYFGEDGKLLPDEKEG